MRMRTGEDGGEHVARHFGCFLRMYADSRAAPAAPPAAGALAASAAAGTAESAAEGSAALVAPAAESGVAAGPRHSFLPGSVVVSADGKRAALVLVPPKCPALAGSRRFDFGLTCCWDGVSAGPRRGTFLLQDDEVSAVYPTALSKALVDGVPAAARLAVGSRVRLLPPAEVLAAAKSSELPAELIAVALNSPADRPLLLPLHPAFEAGVEAPGAGRQGTASQIAAINDWVVFEHGWSEAPGTDAGTARPVPAPAAAVGGAGAAPSPVPAGPPAAPLITHIYSPSTGAAVSTLSLWLEPVAGLAAASPAAFTPEDALLPRILALCASTASASSGSTSSSSSPVASLQRAAARALLAWYVAVAAPLQQLKVHRKCLAEALDVATHLARGPAVPSPAPAGAGGAAAASSNPLAATRLEVPAAAIPPERPGNIGFQRIFRPAEPEAGGGGRGGRDDDRRRTNGGFATEEEAIAEAIRRSLEQLDADDGWEPMPAMEPEPPAAPPEAPLDDETRRILPALLCSLSRLHYDVQKEA